MTSRIGYLECAPQEKAYDHQRCPYLQVEKHCSKRWSWVAAERTVGSLLDAVNTYDLVSYYYLTICIKKENKRG